MDRDGLRDAIRDRLLDVPEVADDLQIDKYEGNVDTVAGREEWFNRFLTAQKGGVAVSYSGSQEQQTDRGRRKQAIITLLLYARFENAALTYLGHMETALNGAKVSVDGDPYWVYWAADAMTGREESYYEYEIRLRIDPD